MADYQIYERPSSVAEAMSHIEELVYNYVDQYEGKGDVETCRASFDFDHIEELIDKEEA